MNTSTCLIIGAGHAASQLAFSLRKEGWDGVIHIIAAEEFPLYQKPFLSKGYLSGDKALADIAIKKRTAYDKKDIEISQSLAVTHIDRKTQCITLSNGTIKSYDKLAICTGASARQLHIQGKEKNNIFYLNTLNDAQNIRQVIEHQTPKKAVIIGGGFIGLEVASSLRKKGIAVTIIESAQRVLARVSAPEISEYFTQLHQHNDVDIVTNKHVEHFIGNANIEGVRCTDGDIYSADIVIVGIGAVPNTTLAEQAKLNVKNGIVVDKFAVTNDPNIVAAGDCTIHNDTTNNLNIRIESVQNAMMQAKNAAAYLCNKTEHINELPWFWSDQYQSKLQIAGLNKGFTHTIYRGEKDKFSVWYFKHNNVIAVDCINDPKTFMFAKKAISHQLLINQTQLQNIDIQLSDLVDTSPINTA